MTDFLPRAGLLLLLLPAPAATPDPTPQELIARHVEASGGRKALERHTAILRAGTVEIASAGINGTWRLARAAPDRYRYDMVLGPVGEVSRGYDGSAGWDRDASGVKLLSGPALADRRRAARFEAELRLDLLPLAMESAGRLQWEGCDCWRVRVTSESGGRREDYYDAGTGLYHGSVEEVDSPMGGKVERIQLVKSYRNYDGLLLPQILIQRLPQIETVITITETSFDATPDSLFARPAR